MIPETTGQEAPGWASLMQPGRWYRISGDEPELGLPPTLPGTRYLEDNDPAQDTRLNPPRTLKERARRALGREWLAPWSGKMGISAMTEAWNSAVFASRFGRSGAMVVFGGGHNNYFGSNVHAFDLDSREWRRLTAGYVAGASDDYGQGAVYPDAVYPDGSPLPPHTYDYVQYDAAGNDYILLKGQTELGPDVRATPIPHLFNLDTLTWRRGPRHSAAILNSGGFSTWDPKRRVLWGHAGDDGGGNAFVAYAPDGEHDDGTFGCWREFHASKLPGEANHNAMQYDPNTDRILVAIHTRDALGMVDPENPGEPLRPVASAGERPTIREYAAIDYSPRLGSFVYYSAGDGRSVYTIRWTDRANWRELTSGGPLDPVADAASATRHAINRAQTFGRFRVAHFGDADVAILVRHTDSPVYAMRLPA